ncbi:MAG: hypothetical protein ABI113_01005, partial [Mucilaginibacter sp.]
MKKFLFGLMSVCTMLLSCKKDHSKADSNATHKVVFNVGFSQSTAAFKTNNLNLNTLKSNSVDTALTNHIGVLYFAVYNSSGNSVHIIKQLSTDASFGSFSDNLPNGTYTLVVAGGGGSLVFVSRTGDQPGNLDTDVLSYGFEFLDEPTWALFNSDTFYKKTTFTVTSADASKNISLDRITSKLVVNIEDALPSNAKTMFLQAFPPVSFDISTGAPSPDPEMYHDHSVVPLLSLVKPITAGEIGTTNYKMSTIVLTSRPFSVSL